MAPAPGGISSARAVLAPGAEGPCRPGGSPPIAAGGVSIRICLIHWANARRPKRCLHECPEPETGVFVPVMSPADYLHAGTATWNRRLAYPSFSFRHGTSLK